MSIVLDGVTKRFGRHLVVDRLDLEILDSELFVLLGASGSGKSTILRIIAGLTMPNEGRIVIHGVDVTHAPAQDRGIGFVFQNYSIFSHMTVAENIGFSLSIRGVDRRTQIQRTEELLDMVGLAGMGGRMPRQLSGGQQQRVALARALAHEPKVLLLDEPFGALDVKIRAHLRRTLKDVQRKLGVTAILVTHDQEEAFEVGDRIGILERGKLLETGEPEELYRSPHSAFAATFLGGGNLLSGRTAGSEAHFGSFTIPLPDQADSEDGQAAHLFFRPEHVRLTEKRPEGDLPVLGRGTVIEQVFAGPCRRIRIRLPRLRGCRQLAPAPRFGEEDWILDAELASHVTLGSGEYWVSLDRWILLKPPRPSLLVFDNMASEGVAHLATARWLASRIDGGVTVLRNRKENEKDKDVRDEVQRRLAEADLHNAHVLVPQGKSSEVLIREQASGNYGFLVLARGRGEAAVSHLGITRLLTRILEEAEVPLLITSHEFRPIRRILLCTAAGEPGKHDVRFGAWLARRIKATVTLMHVLTPNASPLPARGHITNAASTLGSLDIEVTAKVIEDSSPSEAITREASGGDFDLIVMGGHGPHSRLLFEPEDVTLQVLKRLACSILVVPAQEELQ